MKAKLFWQCSVHLFSTNILLPPHILGSLSNIFFLMFLPEKIKDANLIHCRHFGNCASVRRHVSKDCKWEKKKEKSNHLPLENKWQNRLEKIIEEGGDTYKNQSKSNQISWKMTSHGTEKEWQQFNRYLLIYEVSLEDIQSF